MKKITFYALALVSTLAYSQEKKGFGKDISSEVLSANNHERCGTVQYENYLKSIDPNRMSEQQFEEWLAPLIKEHESKKTMRGTTAVYNIPVVIHIVHDGDCLGTGENITDAQAISQLTVMNQDYRKMAGTRGGANSTGLAQDIEINFLLAKRDPVGNPSNGVLRHVITPYSNNIADTNGPDWETRADVEAMKQATIWDPTRYLNMWVIRPGGNPLDHPTSPGLTGLLGYAQFPQGSTLTGITAGTVANTDGVVAAFDAMGTEDLNDGSFMLNPTYNLGRTMTHEVGHWLGLRHIWGDNSTCPASNTDADKDYCSDTPAANTANYNCNLTANTCPTTPGNDQVQNYMDYTPDACMDTFTAKQKARMQTCMANATRRSTLNASNGATAPSAGIYFNLTKGLCDVTESGAECNYTDVNYKVSIIKAPTANATANFTVDGTSTATNNSDFQILTPSIVFPTGSTADQTFTIRYFNDAIAESLETVKINMTVSAGGGDASLILLNAQLSVNIIDNDVAPTVSYSAVAVNENFEGTTPTYLSGARDLDGDGNNWGIGTASAGVTALGFSAGKIAFSRSWISPSTALTPDNILYTPSLITIPTASNLSFKIGTTQAAPYHLEHYSVYLTATNPATITQATLNGLTPVINNAVIATPAGQATITASLAAYAGQSLYLIFRHHNTNDMNWLILDDVTISASGTTQVQTEVNNATKYLGNVSQAGTFYSKDATTNNVMLDATANAFNYGCTNVEVNRSITTAGAAAVNYGTNTANNAKVMAKTFLVTPTNASATGNVAFKFYFTEAEVAAWEAATGLTRSSLRVFKPGDATLYTPTIGAFGTNVTLSATVTTGLGGTYYFGSPNTVLASDTYSLLEDVILYPNPSRDYFKIQLPSGIDAKGSLTIYNNIGQKIDAKNINNENDLTLNVTNYATGVYILNLEIQGAKKTFKFIKE